MPPALVAKLFAVQPSAVITSTDANGAYVAQLDSIRVPEEGPAAKTATAELSQTLGAELEADLTTEFTRGLRRQFPVVIRREVLDRMF